jgi:hypothetical protein
MSKPKQRLPGVSRNQNARLTVRLNQSRGAEIDILGNREGLRALAAICAGLADLTDEELLTSVNHYHLDENFWGTETGSTPLTVYCLEDNVPASAK